MKKNLSYTLLVLGVFVLLAGQAYAQSRAPMQRDADRGVIKRIRNIGMDHPQRVDLTDEQKDALEEAHVSGDREEIKMLLEEYEIGLPPREDQGLHLGEMLTEDQLKELAEIRSSGDKEGVEAKLLEWGIEIPEKKMMDRVELDDEQKEALAELREEGDKEAYRMQLEEWGIEKPQERKTVRNVFRNIFREREAHDDETPARGVRGFFRRMFRGSGE